MKKRNRISHQILSFVLVLVMLLTTVPMTVFAEGQTKLDISKGNIVIGDGTVSGYTVDGNEVTTANSLGYVITGTSDTYTVKVTSGTHSITLQDETIRSSTTSPFDIASGAKVTLTLSGSNELFYTGASDVSSAGLHVPFGAELIINGSGSLSADGKSYSAGIGANKYEVNGKITINSGIINVSGNSGIGLGYYHSSGGSSNKKGEAITINGGTITAQSKSSGAGIGGGSSAIGNYYEVGPITINGGTINAKGGSSNTVDIGGGYWGFVETITVNGGTINGRIGSGKNGSGGQVKNSKGASLKAKTITLPQMQTSIAITEIILSNGNSYGTNDMTTQDIKKLYLYLPNDVTVTTIKTATLNFTSSDNINYYCNHEGHEDKREVTDNKDKKTHTITYTDGCYGIEQEEHSWDDDKMKCIYCPAPYPRISVTTADNNVTYHATFADAVNKASTYTDSTLTLLEPVTLTGTQGIESGSFILDLNGKALSAENNGVLQIGSSATLTVQDNSDDDTINGGIINAVIQNRGMLTIEGGEFAGQIKIAASGTTTIKGGIFPNGIELDVDTDGDTPTINTILADGYFLRDADGKIITVAEDATSVSSYAKVVKGANIGTEAEITLSENEYIYDSTAKTPGVTVKIGGKILKDTDYIVSYENNIAANNEDTVPKVTISAKEGSAYTGKGVKEFTIKPMPVSLTWNKSVFYYTGEEHTVTATDNLGQPVTVSGGTQTDVGEYTATALISDTNYVIDGPAEHDYEIKWYDQAPDAVIEGVQGDNGWYTSNVELKAPDHYTISVESNGSYSSKITLTESAETLTYYLKQENTGYIAKKTVTGIKIDTEVPDVEIGLGENKWNTFFNNITFGLFFKNTQTVTINSVDLTSGVEKIEYIVLEEEKTAEELNSMSWNSYTETLSINPNSKNIIYARVTDKAGHQVIVNSDGIVVYTDSMLNTDKKNEIVYIKTQNESQSFDVNLNGNTISYVKINDVPLKENDYEVFSSGRIVIGEDILEALAAGEYMVTVGFHPMDQVYVAGDVPAEVTIPLKVLKAEVTIEIDNMDKVYDDSPVNILYQIHKSSDSSPAASVIQYNEKVEYKVQGSDDSTYETTVPESAGKYTVRITVDETNLIQSAMVTKDFEIEKKALTILGATVEKTKVYDGSISALITNCGVLNGVIGNDDVLLNTSSAKADYENADVGIAKTVVFSGFTLGGADAKNYQLLQPASVTADITVKDITGGVITLGDYPEYSGKPLTQPIKSVIIDGLDVTYDVTGNVQTEVGFYTLTITAKGNFVGTLSAEYRIVPQISLLDDLTKDNVKSDDKIKLENLLENIDIYMESGKLTKNEKKELENCKKKIEVLLDVIENMEEGEELNKLTDSTSPDSGDNSNIWLWFALLFVSGAGIFGITYTNRKRKAVIKR